MTNGSDSKRQIVFVALGAIILAATVWTDLTAELKFTENTRAGLYEQAYQQAVSKGAPHENSNH